MGINKNINFDSFSHGQIQCKLWLCEQLEPYLAKGTNLVILASWYNVLGFMLATRNPKKFKSIQGIETDKEAVDVANSLCNAWVSGYPIISNDCADVNLVSVKSDVLINCSPEHIEGNDWFTKISPGTIVCIQSSNMTDPNEPWLIKTPCTSIDQFKSMYPLSTTYFCDTMRIQYATWGYDRYMLIGVK